MTMTAVKARSFSKVLFIIPLVAAFVLPSAASAQSVSDLQAQIQALLAQLQSLQQQLQQAQGGGSAQWCHTFTTPLGMNSSGDEVSALQTVLTKEGVGAEKNWASGTFDETTASAVTGFQQKYTSEVLAPLGLKNGTGYAGKGTLKKLNTLYGCGTQPPVVIVPQQSVGITVLSPNGGETLRMGTTQTIRWQDNRPVPTCTSSVAPNCVSPLRLYDVWLASAGCSQGTACMTAPQNIVRSVSDNSYAWQIDTIGTYRVEVCQAGSFSVCDLSDASFSIVPGDSISVPIISGVSGPTTLKVGETGKWFVKAYDPAHGTLTYNITWGDEIGVSSPSVSNGQRLASDQLATFTHAYNTAGTYQPIVTVSNSSGLAATTSADPVSVGSVAAQIQVLSPNGGEMWQVGESHVISWRFNGKFPKGFDIYLEECTLSPCVSSLIAQGYLAGIEGDSNSNNVQQYVWNARTFIPGGGISQIVNAGKYKIGVVPGENKIDAIRFGYGDESAAPFSITGSGGTTGAPVISGVSGPTTLAVGQSGGWTVNATDPAGGTLYYRVVWGDEISYSNVGASTLLQRQSFTQAASFSHTYSSSGTYTPTFSVSNSSGNEAQTSVSVQVGGGTTQPTLSVSVDPATPPSRTIVPGTTDIEVARFQVAVSGENVTLVNLVAGISNNLGEGGCNSYINDLRLIDVSNGTQIGSTISNFSGCSATFTNINYTLPKNSTKTFAIRLSVPATASTGLVFSFDINGFTWLPLQSGRTLQSAGFSSFANTMTIGGNPTASVTVLSPNGGEQWQVGNTQTIRWQHDGAFTGKNTFYSVQLLGDISKGLTGATIMREGTIGVSTNAPSNGEVLWTVPATMKSGSYQLFISEQDPNDSSKRFSDTSDGQITVVGGPTSNMPPKINGGTSPTSVQVGQSATFGWSATDENNDDLSWGVEWGDGIGQAGTCSASPYGGTGRNWNYTTSHAWSQAGTYTVRVTVNDCKGGTNSNTFTVTVGGTTRSSITVLSPNGGEMLQSGSSYAVRWTSNNLPSNALVNVWLLDNPTRLGSMVLAGVPNTGSANWIVAPLSTLTDNRTDSNGQSVTPSGNYVIWIECADHNCTVDDSNSSFTIAPSTQSSITVLSPNGGESYQAGQSLQMPLRWQASCGLSYFNVYLYKGGTLNQTIATNISAGICSAGQSSTPYYTTWAIPSSLAAGNDYTVVVVSGGTQDASNSSFSITTTVQPSITSFTATPSTVNSGGTATLSWTTQGADSAVLKIACIPNLSVTTYPSGSAYACGDTGVIVSANGSTALTFTNSGSSPINLTPTLTFGQGSASAGKPYQNVNMTVLGRPLASAATTAQTANVLESARLTLEELLRSLGSR